MYAQIHTLSDFDAKELHALIDDRSRTSITITRDKKWAEEFRSKIKKAFRKD